MNNKINLILEGLNESRSEALTFDDFTVKGAKFKLNQDVHYSDFIDFADSTGIKDIDKVKKLGFKIDNEHPHRDAPKGINYDITIPKGTVFTTTGDFEKSRTDKGTVLQFNGVELWCRFPDYWDVTRVK